MDKDILYRFFEGCASVEEIRQVKEWAEASDEHRKSLRRERKLFNAMILAGQPVQKDMRMTIMRRRNHYVGELLKIASVVVVTVIVTATLFLTGKDKGQRNNLRYFIFKHII